MSPYARDFNNIETRAVTKYFFLQGKVPKEIKAILRETQGKMHHHIPPSKTWWPSLKVVICPRVLRLVLNDPE